MRARIGTVSNIRTLALIWLAWCVTMAGFQALVDGRMQPQRPDEAVFWSAHETMPDSQNDKRYLVEPFMNRHVSWDSEFYLSISIAGYDDPDVRFVRTPKGRLSLNYAFFPMYPAVMRVVRQPFGWFGLNDIASATLAGVLISLVATLFAMIALNSLSEEDGLRSAFYFLIFPSSFFLAQVYTEGLFAAFAFGSLALMRRQWLVAAGILAALATWTRAAGLLLVIPMGLAWLQTVDRHNLKPQAFLRALPLLLPLAAYLIWRHFLGTEFSAVEESWFGRSLFDFERLSKGTKDAWQAVTSGDVSERRIYFAMEFISVMLAGAACLFTLRKYPGVALFGIAALILAVTSGAPQSWVRYVLVIPPLFLFLGRLGRNQTFDRVWTVFSVLLLGMQAALFTWDMWVA